MKMYFIGKGKRKRERINRKKEKIGKLFVVSWMMVLYIKFKVFMCDINKISFYLMLIFLEYMLMLKLCI